MRAHRLSRRIDHVLHLDPDAPAVEFEQQWFSWKQLGVMADRVAALIGDERAQVGILLRNRPVHVAALLGVLRRGATVVVINPARGGELFRLNCASCHNFTGRGGALSAGKYAPNLDPASEEQIYTAMLTGPQNMPKFSDRQLSPEEKKDIVAYVKSVSDGNNNPGGNGLGGVGPASEGVIAFIVGIAALIGVTLWIGSKA